MLKGLGSLTKAGIYTIIVILMGVLFSKLPGINGQIYMLTPGITVLMMMFLITRDGYSKSGWKTLGLHKLGIKKWGFALTVPLIIHLVGYCFLWAIGMGEITFSRLEGVSPIVMIIATIPMLFIYTITYSIAEEIGWRGYLLPHLQRLGIKQALLVSGFIHGCWHLPLILFTTQYHAEGNRWVVVPLFLASITIVGVVIGYVRIVTDSVWPAAIIHAMHNTIWGRFALITESDSPYSEILTGDTGIIQLILYGIVGLYIIKKIKNNHANKAGHAHQPDTKNIYSRIL